MKAKFIALAAAAAVSTSLMTVPVAGAQTAAIDPARLAQVDAVAAEYTALGLGETFVTALKRELNDDIRDTNPRDFNEDIAEASQVAELLKSDAALLESYLAKQDAAVVRGDLEDDFIDPVKVRAAVAKTTSRPTQPTTPTQPTNPTQPTAPAADRETALADTLAKFKDLGLADNYIKRLEADLREEIKDRDRDFEEDIAKANEFADALAADEAKLAYFKPVAAKVESFTDLDDDMYDIRELNRVYNANQNADRAYRDLQDDDLGDRIEDRVKNSSSGSSDRNDDRFDDADDILEIILAILGVLGLVGAGAAAATAFDIF